MFQAKGRWPKGAGQQSRVYEIDQDEERGKEQTSRWDLVRLSHALDRCLQHSGTIKSWTSKKMISHGVSNRWDYGPFERYFT